MNKWQLIITRGYNGFITEEHTEETINIKVFQEKETDDKEYLVEMLYSILETFGEQGSKYDKKRIEISINDDNTE